jgi:hypothetical protein
MGCKIQFSKKFTDLAVEISHVGAISLSTKTGFHASNRRSLLFDFELWSNIFWRIVSVKSLLQSRTTYAILRILRYVTKHYTVRCFYAVKPYLGCWDFSHFWPKTDFLNILGEYKICQHLLQRTNISINGDSDIKTHDQNSLESSNPNSSSWIERHHLALLPLYVHRTYKSRGNQRVGRHIWAGSSWKIGWLLGVKKSTFLFYVIQKQAVGSKESIPPAYVAWRAGPVPSPIDCSKITAQLGILEGILRSIPPSPPNTADLK